MSNKSSKSSVMSESDTISVQTEQLSKLVCPVCFEYMKPPIMMCEKEHGICELCHELLTTCPICKSTLTHRRSSHLEILTSLVLFPCKQCHEKYSLDEFAKHTCTEENNEPFIICLIGQVYGRCNWRGLTKDMMDHISEVHTNNYWTKKENLAKWNVCQLSQIGIQQLYVLDLTDAIFVIVQKFDSNSQSLHWNVSCECEKSSNHYGYEIQLYSNNNLEIMQYKKVIENDNNIMMSLPSHNEIVVPISKVKEFVDDNNYVYYKVIIHTKSEIQNMETICEIRENIVDADTIESKQSCTKKTWYSIVDFYHYIKHRLGC